MNILPAECVVFVIMLFKSLLFAGLFEPKNCNAFYAKKTSYSKTLLEDFLISNNSHNRLFIKCYVEIPVVSNIQTIQTNKVKFSNNFDNKQTHN